MGVRPDNHADFMFNSKPVQTDGGHPVPVTNFMNAQCTFAFCRDAALLSFTPKRPDSP